MEQTKKNIPTNTTTRTISELDAPTGNIYQSVNIIARRANEVAAQTKTELQRKLQDFVNTPDSLEETFENREQIELSKHYERLPKPVLVATEEFLSGEIEVERKAF
ncbi:MAG: DNA-directed RNA polymerase subunit omega [Rikenellaceae bacterium]